MTAHLEHPLVLVPALGCDERLWAPVVDQLAALVDCLVLRGSGDSVAAEAADVLTQAPAEFHLAGISLGGYVALDIALRAGGRVRSLALLNTSAVAAPRDRRQASLDAVAGIDAGHFDAVVDRMSGAVAAGNPEVAALAAGMARDLGPQVVREQHVAVAHRHDRRGELASLGMPTLVLVGEDDVVAAPELGIAMVQTIPRARVRTLPGVGHLSTLEAPDQVAALLRGHLTSL